MGLVDAPTAADLGSYAADGVLKYVGAPDGSGAEVLIQPVSALLESLVGAS